MNGLHRYCEIQDAIQLAAHEATVNGKTFEGENFCGKREKQFLQEKFHSSILVYSY